jgi:uncharacterized membrane protein YjfL (UPF0719 family)
MDALSTELQLAPIISTFVYSLIGIIIFVVAFLLLEFFTPFSIKKEIEAEKNTALGIIIGAVFIALAIIIAAAIH